MKEDVRILFLCLVLFLYAFSGSPTPDNPGFLEVLMGGLLLLSLRFKDVLFSVFSILKVKQPYWAISVFCLLIYGLSVPVILALINGHSISYLLRDTVGFLFLCLPFFLWPLMRQREENKDVLFLLILLIGFVFSLRVLFPDFLLWAPSYKLLYLANSPLVLFSTLFILSYGFYQIYERVSFRRLGVSLLLFGVVSIPLLAMFADLQRASVLAIIFTLATLLVMGFIKAPLKMLAPIAVFLVLAFSFFPFLSAIIENVEVKTTQVGLNMRLQEFYAIWGAMNYSWISILFGQGWGASFASPAVGELHVTYSHSLLSYVLFKMGLVGLCLTLIYLFFVFEKLVRLYFSNPLKGNAFMWPLLIPIFLYASHKSLDYGLLLSLIVFMAPLSLVKKERVIA